MKKYIEPAIEIEKLLTLDGMMQITASDDETTIPVDGPGSGGGDAKGRFDDKELEEALNQQKNGWEDGLW